MPEPLVSVIIPAYNGEQFIAEAIESALGQTYEPVEVVVVDDGSADRSAEIAAGFPGVAVLRQRNAGPAAARNAGVAASSGDIISFHDQDDVMLPDKLETQVRMLHEHPTDAFAIAPTHEFILEEGASLPDWDRMIAPAVFDDAEDLATFIGSMTLVMWRRLFDRVGPFDTTIFGGDDVDWMFRAIESDVDFVKTEKVVVRRRIHLDNITQDEEVCRRAILACFRARIKRRRADGVTPDDRFGPPQAPA